ncbi:MAG: SDR family NAD(P)-dependent oxidoreductase [Chloroflexota bacterium]
MERFKDRVVLVTGAGSGLGRAAVHRFAQEGGAVVIADIDTDVAGAVQQEIVAGGGRAHAVRADVTSAADCEAMVQAAVSTFGQLDVVFANAGIGGHKTRFTDMDMSIWDDVMAINLRGMVLTCKAVVAQMIKGEGGSIVLMGSSTGGWDTIDGSGPYMMSKEAVKAMARNLALELGGYNIRVNAVCPGIIQTQLSFRQGTDDPQAWEKFFGRFARRIPLRRVGQPEDVAATVAFLASDDARHITGASLLIDGGQTLQSWSNSPAEDAYPLHNQEHEDT